MTHAPIRAFGRPGRPRAQYYWRTCILRFAIWRLGDTDVKCTWDLLTGRSSEKLRLNPRKAWYRNLKEVTTNGDYEVTFDLQRPQPVFIALLASGFSVVYPCHVAPNEMRQNPIGTGPFKFVEFRPNERIMLARNPDYWKPGRPYLDGVEFPIIREVSTANLAFIAGKLDWIGTTIPLLKDVRSQAPGAICEVTAGGISRNLVINRDVPPDAAERSARSHPHSMTSQWRDLARSN